MQTLESIKDLSKHKDSLGLHFGHRWPLHFGCVCGFSRLCHAFLEEALSQDMVHIDDVPLMGDAHVALGILSSCVIYRLFYFP